MSTYTTGEIAKLCGVTVRTVQYYDTRKLLVPDQLSQGGRRLYSEDSLKRMKVICFLRELGLPIDSIAQLLSEEDPGSVIHLLLDQQEKQLQSEIGERKEKLDKLQQMKADLKEMTDFSVESIGDIAITMRNKKSLKKVHQTILAVGIPMNILQWVTIILWIAKGIWIPFVIWAAVAIPVTIFMVRYYYDNVSYICPKCHSIFRPSLKEMFFAKHTPAARKLTCTACGYHGFCVEVAERIEEN